MPTVARVEPVALDPTSGIGQHLATSGPGVYDVAWGVEALSN